VPGYCVGLLLAEEDQPQGGQGVERDPEARYQLLLEGQRRLLGGRGLLDVWQLFQLVGLAGIDVVDETVG
jgi:hypothetical protein